MRTTERNFPVAAIVVMALLMLGACTGESPTAPPVTPPGGGGPSATPTPGSGGNSIALGISNADPLVQSTSTITATVTINGQPAPNGTAVEFETTLGTFADTGGTISLRTTTNGVATAILTSATVGTARVTARLPGLNNVFAEGTVNFRSQPQGPTPIVTSISSISPTRGGPAGGQEVVIRGQNFRDPVRVLFGNVMAAAQLISATEIRAIAPSVNLGPSNQFLEVDVVVISEAGTPVEQRATSPQKYRYELEVLQPGITTLAPSSGPNEGRTRVTIFGEGFQAPVRVFFGTSGAAGPLLDEVEADIVSAPTFNQIIVMTPPALGLGAPLANQQVTVRVLNVLTGREAFLERAFRYGPDMRITAAGPTTLSATGGTRVTIDGWGFDDPVAVSLAGVAADPIFVSGTRIIVIAGRPVGCGGATGPVSVTNIEDGTNAIGDIVFTYLQPVVTITGVTPSTAAAGTSVTLTVAGVTGAGSPRVTIGDSTVIASTSSITNGVGTFTFNVPTGLTFRTEACSAGGTRPVPTPFSLTFEERGSGCPTDTLTNALTITPPDTGVLRLQPTSLTLNATVGSSATNSFQIINNGAGPLSVTSVSAPAGVFTVTSPAPTTLGPCEAATVNVTFTPVAAGSFSTNVTVSTTAGSSTVAVTGTATAPAP